jgi:hypothetical protein
MPDDIEELTRLRIRIAELEAEVRRLRLAGATLLREWADARKFRVKSDAELRSLYVGVRDRAKFWGCSTHADRETEPAAD